MLITDRACSETNFSMCKYITDKVCVNASRRFVSHGIKIASPATVTLLVVILLFTARMIGHVKALCSSVGRKEMLTFFYLYSGSTVLEIVLVGFKDAIPKPSHLFLTTAQITLYTSAFFSLFVGSITIDMFTGILGLRAISLLKIATSVYSACIGAMIFTGLSTNTGDLVTVPFFLLNIVFFSFYLASQLRKLRKTNGEIWAYGTLSISLLCFITSNIITFIGSGLIALLTDRYFDNLFFYHFFILCTFVMIHKYWLSVYNYEVESLQLEV